MQTALAVFEKEMILEASATADPDRKRILELEQYKKDGSTVWMEASLSFLRNEEGNPVEILAVTRDISERKIAELALRESEEQFRLMFSSSPDAVNINRIDDGLYVDINEGFARATGYTREEAIGNTALEAIGTLAGGIAHDFNNLLMGIQGRASMIALDLDASHPHREQIHAIEEYIRSATSLTQQLFGFARGGIYEVKPIDINELMNSSSGMFGRTRKEIRIHTK
jgi:PAS domain-containing protein